MSVFEYNGRVEKGLIEQAKETFCEYRADKEELVARLRDNERFYRDSYTRMERDVERRMVCDTPFIFSAVENTRADLVDNYPSANILEREPDGTGTAELLSKIVPAQLEISDFKRIFKDNSRNKLKYGTAVYGVFYNDFTGNIDIRSIDLLDVYVDMHIPDIQESRFMFIRAAVENSTLAEEYPQFKELFSGDAEIETLERSYRLKNRTSVTDCYYKKPDGTVHMFKLCADTVIAATEDMEGYEGGLYNHGQYPVVFDVLYPAHHCPFGFGMIDIGKTLQIGINKLDRAITENIMCGAKPRYLAKRNGGINETEFRDLSRSIVHYEGETEALKPIDHNTISEYYLSHRESKKEELKEILGNRDFQQGQTTGGVTAASAIETLRQTGEKRSRSVINDTYDSYKRIVYMMLELMRQFFSEERVYRITDELGQKAFARFRNSMMYRVKWSDTGAYPESLVFDIDVVPQRESPYARETVNKTIMDFWNGGMISSERAASAIIALKNMNFDGKDRLIADMRTLAGSVRETEQEVNEDGR